MKEKKRFVNGRTVNMVERSGEAFGLTGSRVDGVNEPKTKPWTLPPEMLKPGGPSPRDHEIVPSNKTES